MFFDWTQVSKLISPIQATREDVIFSGYGISSIKGWYHHYTRVPDGVELCLLAPLEASIADVTGQALANKTKIDMLGIKNPNINPLFHNAPIFYPAGSVVPNLVLRPPRGITIKPDGPRILGVATETKLSALWERVLPFKTAEKPLRCYWASCTPLENATHAVVLHRELDRTAPACPSYFYSAS